MPYYWSKLSLIGLLLLSTVVSFGQIEPKENSPYSRYGLGNLISSDFAAVQSMGGISAGYSNPFQLNITNPASTASLNYTAFETGAFAEYSVLSSGDESATGWNGNISHFALGFPLKNPLNKLSERKRSPYDFGMALGLQPYSIVGYDVESTSTLPNIGDVTYKYLGNGGTYQAFVSSSAKYKGFSLGGHFGYLFGNMNNEKSVYFNDLEYAFSNVFRNEYSLSGATFRLGVQYEWIIGKTEEDDLKTSSARPRLTVGAYANTTSTIGISGSSIAARTNSFYTGSNLDTIFSSIKVEDDMTLPAEYGIGFTYFKLLKWKFGADFKMSQWSKYNNPLKQETLGDSWTIAAGGEYIPNYRSFNRYIEQIRYRAGFHYGTDPRLITVNNESVQLTNYGLTLGVGFPLRLPRGLPSFVNLGLEAGRLAAPDLLQENYIKINLGFTLNDNTWFYKQKYN